MSPALLALLTFQIESHLCLASLNCDPHIYASQVTGIPVVCHHTQLSDCDEVLPTCLGWLQTGILPISASQEAGIIDVSFLFFF
jgi:hypothetical protein